VRTRPSRVLRGQRCVRTRPSRVLRGQASGYRSTLTGVLYAPAKAIVRIVMIVVGVVICLYLIFLLRKPIGWLLVSAFLAVALSGPVNWLNLRMKRGFAIATVYLTLLAIPLLLIALIVPPLITEANNFAEDLPKYSRQLNDFVEGNSKLRKLNEDYAITDKLQKEAEKLPERLGGAAKTLSSVGVGLVNSVFALVTILILTAFMLGGGHRWRDAALASRPREQRERLERSLDHIGAAVGGYMAGALTVAAIAGIATYVILTILGVPFRGPLAVMAGLFSLIPLVGATVAAFIIGVVTLFNDFPTDTIVWIVWAIVYQQIENNLIQPQIQKRTVNVHPFITIVAVLFGSSLLGILGAVVAIPIAASIQILLREYWDWRTLSMKEPEDPEPQPPPPPAGAADDPAPA
jgi:predicted PurR-regulated permease PerM